MSSFFPPNFKPAALTAWLLLWSPLSAEIIRPDDAPPPLSPESSQRQVQLPPGFRLELVAAEPLIREPSGVCWDARGRTYVCELHGYNLEGQYDIEELNETGQLDRVVRRIEANEQAKNRASHEESGTVKQLVDDNGDGKIDRANVWASDLPPCLGVCPARDGVVVICPPDIVVLADRDGDGRAEMRETIFTGFNVAKIERRMNCPQWGLDNWIYVGRGRGGQVSGPNLTGTVDLPATDFRFKPDGTAIEPVTGGTHTFGFAIDEGGNRYTVSTGSPAYFVAPLPWRYLARNTNASVPRLDINISPGQKTYPISQPHPWRTKRAADPGFAKYYADNYGKAESEPNGYFTSACSPFVYQDVAIPGLRGHLLSCEPAQNMIFRAIRNSKPLVPTLRRHESENEREFLASRDPWFHPIYLAHAPDGSIAIVDFYREIIEDYSAIPRYLQQQYGLVGGQNYGRLWRLTHHETPNGPPADMSRLSARALAGELSSPHFWRRQTAQRLLVERNATESTPAIRSHLEDEASPAAVLGALYTLEGLGRLTVGDVRIALTMNSRAVRVHAIRLAERWIDDESEVMDAYVDIADSDDPALLIQLAMSLGESTSAEVLPTLAKLMREHGDIRWMDTAVLSSLAELGVDMLAELIGSQVNTDFLQRLSQTIGAGRVADDISRSLELIADADDRHVQHACLGGLCAAFDQPRPVRLTDGGYTSLRQLAASEHAEIRALAGKLVVAMRAESSNERERRITRAKRDMANFQVDATRRLAAVAELAMEDDPSITLHLLGEFSSATPVVRSAILESLLSQRARGPEVVAALETGTLPVSALSQVQREALRRQLDAPHRARVDTVFASPVGAGGQALDSYLSALEQPRDFRNGDKMFREHCANCHRANGIGHSVGPDLTSESHRAEETLVRDILSPNDAITAGFTAYLVQSVDGRTFTGLLAAESPSNVTLRQAEGREQVVLRKEVESLTALPVSLMPDGLHQKLRPQDVADIIAWIRGPDGIRVLFDEDSDFPTRLTQGNGTAAIVWEDRHQGQVALRVTPLQRYSARLADWNFRIREHPAVGEYRYLRFAWKSVGARGIMIELANNGHWPAPEEATLRYASGANVTDWMTTQVSDDVPTKWTVVTRDLWQECGDCTITGIAPTAMDGPALFDAIELHRNARP